MYVVVSSVVAFRQGNCVDTVREELAGRVRMHGTKRAPGLGGRRDRLGTLVAPGENFIDFKAWKPTESDEEFGWWSEHRTDGGLW